MLTHDVVLRHFGPHRDGEAGCASAPEVSARTATTAVGRQRIVWFSWVAPRRLSKLISHQYFPNIIGGILGSLNVRRADATGVDENIPLALAIIGSLIPERGRDPETSRQGVFPYALPLRSSL
jgi:hypothetical protein